MGHDGTVGMMRRLQRRIRRNNRGGYDLRLPDEERQLLQVLPSRLLELLDGVRPEVGVPEELRRLFPPAYVRDEPAEQTYRELQGGGLLEHHLESLRILERTATATHLSDEEADAWLAAMNDLRLSIGTRLGVTEEVTELDPSNPSYPDWICYQYLSYLQTEAVDAMFGALPPPTAGADDQLPDDPWGEPPGDLRWDGTPRPNPH
jgi:hypothetical protein